MALAVNWIGRILCVPPGNQFIGGLAYVFTVDDPACEYIWDIQPVGQWRVGTVLNIEGAIQGAIGRPRAQPFDLDSPACAAVFDDLVTQFLDAIIQCGFHQPDGTRD